MVGDAVEEDLAEAAPAAALRLFTTFLNCSESEQTELPRYADQLVGLKGAHPELALAATQFRAALDGILEALDWRTSDESAECMARLGRVISEFSVVDDLRAELGEALAASLLGLVLDEVGNEEHFRRLGLCLEGVPLDVSRALSEKIVWPEWDDSDPPVEYLNTALRIELQLPQDERTRPPYRLMFQSFRKWDLPGAPVLKAWAALPPATKDVIQVLRVLRWRSGLADAVQVWGSVASLEDRTAVAKAVVSRNWARPALFRAAVGQGVDQSEVISYAGKRIRSLQKVSDRQAVSRTVGAVVLEDEKARAACVRIICWALDSRRRPGDYEVFRNLLASLGREPLADASALTVALRQAQNRREKKRRLKLTEAQAKQLIQLGAVVALDGFGKNVRKSVEEFADQWVTRIATLVHADESDAQVGPADGRD